MTIEASGKFKSEAKIQYLLTLVYVKALHLFHVLSAEVEGSTPETLGSIILCLGTYFYPVNALPKQNRAMRRIMRKPSGLKVRH